MRNKTQYASEPLLWNEVINGLVLLKPLLHADEKIDTVNHALHELNLREAEAI